MTKKHLTSKIRKAVLQVLSEYSEPVNGVCLTHLSLRKIEVSYQDWAFAWNYLMRGGLTRMARQGKIRVIRGKGYASPIV